MSDLPKDTSHHMAPNVQAMLHTFTAFMALKDPVLLASLGLQAPVPPSPVAPTAYCAPATPSSQVTQPQDLVQTAKDRQDQ